MSKAFSLFCITLVSSIYLFAAGPYPDDYFTYGPMEETLIETSPDTIPAIQDRQGDYISTPNQNPFDLKDPAVIERNVEYDVETGQYIITEKLGDDYFRAPTYMSFQEYMDYRAKQQEQSYFNNLAGVKTDDDNISGRIDPISKLSSEIENNLVNRLFGGTGVSIEPQGNIDLTFGLDYQKTENLNLSPFQRRQQARPQFNFDMDIQMNVEGKIGEKLNLNTNYNTGATFDFENQLNLGYDADAFSEDDIIKNIEAGNVSLPLRGTLIQGSQNLFGLRTDLQFGYLKLSLLASQQKSQRESIQLEGGAQVQKFEVFADQYDENRHFFLSHYNQQTFEEALRNLPQVNSLFKISKIQVWITNDRNALENVREIVALSDLGESEVTQKIPPISPPPNRDIFGRALPSNNSNNLERDILDNKDAHVIDQAVSILQSAPFNFVQTEDYEKVRARMLSSSEFSYDADLGYISVNVNLQPDQVLGVAYEYTYNGRVFRVGEFANDVASGVADSDDCNSDPLSVLYLKMLKSSANRIDLPTWDLMMKNIYNVGAYQVDEQEFRLEVLYQDPGGGDKRFIPEPELSRFPLLRLFNLDNLNILRDPQPDGVFDFVPGLTINPRNGRVMFPVLEPFGSSLERQIRENVDSEERADRLVRQYTFPQLYDSTLFVAREYPELNRFTLKGEYKSSVSSEISLGAFNIPRPEPGGPPTVIVTAGGAQLKEGQDYEVDYNIGRVRILNDAYISSGVPINVSFEDNTLFGFQTKTLLGVRADYELGKNANVGATFMQLFERPFTQKVNIGDDPINNKVYGLDFNFQKEAPFITKALDALPFYSTKAESSISLTAELATLKPGHSKAINQADDEGAAYIDDFEGSASSLDLRTPTTQWVLASVPRTDDNRFPEADLVNNVDYGVNRAHLNWYRIDQTAYGDADPEAQQNPYTRLVRQEEIFPNVQLANNQNFQIQALNLYYDPSARGPYNFDVPGGVPGISEGLTQSGQLVAPETRWGGIMRSMQNIDFQRNNYEFIEIWVLSPFIGTSEDEGELVFNLGSVSEDILRDSRRFFENGLPTTTQQENRQNSGLAADTCNIDPALDGVDVTNWSRIPRSPNVTSAFGNDERDREEQDVGLDGFNDEAEVIQFGDYLSKLQGGGLNPNVLDEITNDPANDNFIHFSNTDELPSGGPLIQRYLRFNGTEGNSQTSNEGDFNNFRASTNQPDSEDLDRNNSLNETESYYEYRIPFSSDGDGGIELNDFITDVRVARVDPNTGDEERWYRLKIPLNQFTGTVGGISDFRSIRFMRMYLTGFTQPKTFRFARLELVRNQWRRYTRELGTTFGVPTNPPLMSDFDINSVNIEENNGRLPFGYVLPPGIVRENSLGPYQNALQNEQALTIKACNLPDGDARAIFKIINMDMRVYERMKMFVHAEDPDGLADIDPGEAQMFIRIGSDFEENYYEYELPLTMSDIANLPPPDPNSLGPNRLDEGYINEVWKEENFVDLPLDSFQSIKKRRNAIPGANINAPFVVPFEENPGSNISVVGNPNLGLVKGLMIGVRNKRDNGLPICTEVWVNELRLSGFDERGGSAGVARMDMQLADLGNFTAAGNFSTIGWGQLEQKVNERSRERYVQYDLATNLELGKFLPEKWGIKVPFLAQHSVTTYTPEFDPFDLDIPLDDKLKSVDASQRDSIRDQARDFSSISSINFSNVRKERTNSAKKPMPWDISNFSASYNHTKVLKKNALIEKDQSDIYRGGIDYSYSLRPKYIQPFKKVKNKNLKFIKEINFNPIPNSFTFNTVLDRHLQETSYRFVEEEFKTYFIKKFTWERNYDLKWDLMKAIKFNFQAENQGVVDELDDEGNTIRNELYNGTSRDYIWENIKNGGRTKNYYHSLNASVNVPFKNFPLLDFISLKGQYSATYDWNAASLNTDSLGNVIQNSSNRQVNLDLDFNKLYNKSKYLKQINSKARKSRKPKKTTSNRNKSKSDGKEDKDGKKKKEKKDREISGVEKALIRPLLLLKKVRLNYSEQFGSVVPGFTPQAGLFGQQNFSEPGWDYVLGASPNDAWFDRISDKDNNYQNSHITSNVFLNQQVQKDYVQTIDARVTLEPVRDLRIELEANRRYQENHTEFFKDTLRNDIPVLEHVNERDIGSLTISYFALNTLFEKDIYALFGTFENNRRTISNRLADAAPITLGAHAEEGGRGFREGYGGLQQDVLIPAFLAAYTGNDPSNTELYEDARDFKNLIPRPNWRMTYNGLSKIKGLEEIFQNVSITHGYKSTLTVNSFNTNFQFENSNPYGLDNLNKQSSNYYTRFEVPTIVIREAFSPLLGLDMRMKNGMQVRVEFKKSRDLSFSLLTSELDETKVSDYVFGFSHRLSDVNIPFLQFGTNKKKKKNKKDEKDPPSGLPGGGRQGQGQSQPNDLNITFDMSFRDDITVKHILDRRDKIDTRGSKALRLSPSIDYAINSQLNLRFFIDYNRVINYVSTSPNRTNFEGGFVVRFSLN